MALTMEDFELSNFLIQLSEADKQQLIKSLSAALSKAETGLTQLKSLYPNILKKNPKISFDMQILKDGWAKINSSELGSDAKVKVQKIYDLYFKEMTELTFNGTKVFNQINYGPINTSIIGPSSAVGIVLFGAGGFTTTTFTNPERPNVTSTLGFRIKYS